MICDLDHDLCDVWEYSASYESYPRLPSFGGGSVVRSVKGVAAPFGGLRFSWLSWAPSPFLGLVWNIVVVATPGGVEGRASVLRLTAGKNKDKRPSHAMPCLDRVLSLLIGL